MGRPFVRQSAAPFGRPWTASGGLRNRGDRPPAWLSGLHGKLGAAVFLPSALGGDGAIGLVVAVARGRAPLATWNEETRKLSAV